MTTANGGLVILLFLGLAGSARGQNSGFICSASAGLGPTIRAEGLTELVGDVILTCTGGTPTPAGQPLPQFNFTLLLTANLTSAPTAGNQFNEALLIVDEPASTSNPTRPILNCGNSGAPDNGSSGPGVCSTLSTGNPITNYDGTPDGYGSATCDGASGRPAANSYGCGRPNVFQGRLGTPQTPGQLNAVTFYNVPIDPPGTGTTRTLRVTNLRANASSMSVSSTFPLIDILATVSVNGPVPIIISNPVQYVAYLGSGLFVDPTCCTSPVGVRIVEGFGPAWKAKNFSFAAGNGGVPGNANLPTGLYWVYDGGTNYPPDIAQNVPGAIYNTETGFEWLNNGANGPPSPNPPYGTSAGGPVIANTAPLNSAGFGGFNTGINKAGVAEAGTRFAFRFSGIPQGASVQVPQVVYLFNGLATSGVMVLTNADSAGAGAFNPASSGTLPGNLAVYEILWADPFSIEAAEVNYTLIGAPPGTTLQVATSFAPFYSDSGSRQADASYPVPRFLGSSEVCSGQSCLNVTPNQATNAAPVQLTFTYYGSQTLTDAQVLLRGSGVPDILGLNVAYPASNMLTATFDLAGAAVGARDVVITPVTGPAIMLPGGFSILQTPACAYSVAASSTSFTAAGGSGSFIVTSSDLQCGWTANTAASWITLAPISQSFPLVQPFTIAANSGSGSRNGTISIAGETITVSQEGSSTCDYSISPGSNVFPVAGGTFAVNVTAQPGCAWTTVSSLSWVSFPNGSSGSGNGSVIIQTAANSGGPLYGSITIAGQTFQVRQSGDACGATDVSSQVTVTRKALLNEFYNAPWTQQLVLTNQGPSVPGPVYVVLDGLCVLYRSCPFYGGYQLTSCPVPDTPMVLVAADGLASGQTVYYDLQFYESPYLPLSAGVPVNSVSTRVFSGTPSQ